MKVQERNMAIMDGVIGSNGRGYLVVMNGVIGSNGRGYW